MCTPCAIRRLLDWIIWQLDLGTGKKQSKSLKELSRDWMNQRPTGLEFAVIIPVHLLQPNC